MIPAGWNKEPLSNWIEEFREKSVVNDQHPVLTSSRNGLIPQSEYYGDAGRITSRDNVGFHVVPPMHITYRSRSDDGLFFFNRNETGITGIVSHFYPVFRFKGNDTFFLALLENIRNRIGDYAVGSSQRVLSLNALKSVEAIIPPIEEQQRIAQILSTWDRAIEATEKLIANSQAQKKALMQKLLTSKKRLPGFSGKWHDVRLSEVAEIFSGGTPSTSEQTYWDGDIPWMASGEVNLREVWAVEGRITDQGLKNSSTRMVPANSILVALAGQGKTRGKVAINRIALCTNQSLAAIVLTKGYYCDYLFHNLDSRYEELRSMSLGDGGRGGLNLSIIGKVIVPMPSEDEQRAIAHALTLADRKTAALQKEQDALRTEKSALMQQLLTGKRRMHAEETANA
jgi:type I restriction enzyme S subunit